MICRSHESSVNVFVAIAVSPEHLHRTLLSAGAPSGVGAHSAPRCGECGVSSTDRNRTR